MPRENRGLPGEESPSTKNILFRLMLLPAIRRPSEHEGLRTFGKLTKGQKLVDFLCLLLA